MEPAGAVRHRRSPKGELAGASESMKKSTAVPSGAFAKRRLDEVMARESTYTSFSRAMSSWPIERPRRMEPAGSCRDMDKRSAAAGRDGDVRVKRRLGEFIGRRCRPLPRALSSSSLLLLFVSEYLLLRRTLHTMPCSSDSRKTLITVPPKLPLGNEPVCSI